MHIEYLEECLVLAQTLNFTRAAEKLYMAQPVLSRHVSKLEGELGIKLFVRTRHGMRVTRAGSAFLADAQRVVDAYHAMMDNLKSEAETLRIGFVSVTCSKYIMEIQRRFKEVLPSVATQYNSMNRIWQPMKRLEDGTIDIAIGAVLESSMERKFRYRELYEDMYYVVVRAGHPLSGRDVVSLEDLARYEVIFPDERLVEQDDELKKSLGGAGQLHISYTLHDVDSLPLMLAESDAVSVTMGSLQDYYAHTADLVFLPIKGIDTKLPIVVAWNEKAESDSLLALIDIVEDLLGSG